MAAKGGHWKETTFQPAKGVAHKPAAPLKTRHVVLKGNPSARDELANARDRLEALRSASWGKRLTERYQPVLAKLRDAAEDIQLGIGGAGARHRLDAARAELQALRAQRSQEQNRQRLQGDLFAGFVADRPSPALARMRFARARVDTLRAERDQRRAVTAARREIVNARHAARAESRRRKFEHRPEFAAKVAGERRVSADALAAAKPAPKGMVNVHLGDGRVAAVRLSYRKGALGVTRDALGNVHVHELKTGMPVARFKSLEAGREFASGAHRSIGRILDRIEAGDAKARTALLSYVKRHQDAALTGARGAEYRRLIVKPARLSA